MARQAAIDSIRTDAVGGYRFRVAAPDTGSLYLVSIQRDGIAYFSQPLRVAPGASVKVDPITVYDTSSRGDPVAVERLLVTFAKAKSDGSRDVLHVLELHNRDLTTRIAPDTTRPTWRGVLPAGALQFQVGESDFSPQAVALKGDTVMVFGPVQPGPSRQLSFAYVLPANATTVELPVDQPISQVHILLEDTTATVEASVTPTPATEHIEGRTFRRYSMTAIPAGARLTVKLPGSGAFTVERAIPWIVGAMILALLGGLVVAVRKRPPTSA